ncbi:MAG: hypothetical protein LBR07_10250 [Puniceicoccales bacterium]|jgi:hypothetical protein|nr:hypothetical protein [Puniceicoccales bacterium]
MASLAQRRRGGWTGKEYLSLWLVAGAVSLALCTVPAVLFRPGYTLAQRADADGTGGAEKTSIGCLSQGQLREYEGDIELRDTEPLYIPTKWNYGQHSIAAEKFFFAQDIGGDPLEGFAPTVSDVSENLLRSLENPAPLNGERRVALIFETLSLRSWGLAAGMGSRAIPPDAAPAPRQASVRVVSCSADGGKVLFEEPLDLGLPAEIAGMAWKPVTLTLWVDEIGAISPTNSLVGNSTGGGIALATESATGTGEKDVTGAGSETPLGGIATGGAANVAGANTDGAPAAPATLPSMSGVPEIDAAIRKKIETPEFRARLGTGYFRVTVGP